MIFRFKQFSVHQGQSAMKIGTDGVLLGAWSPVENRPASVLDIGAGTGLISLMLAQRSQAQTIDAVEIDPDAYVECTDNFENSPWADRLFCYFASFEEFVEEMTDQKYDLIVSNPPFYTSDYKTETTARNKARFEESLPFETLLDGVSQLLSSDGIFCVILPFSQEETFVTKANQHNLFAKKITRVKGNATSPIKRSLMAFSAENITPSIDELVIENQRNVYTQNYINLTKDFYLKM